MSDHNCSQGGDIVAAIINEAKGARMELFRRAMPPYAERLAFIGVIGSMTLRGISSDAICRYAENGSFPEPAFEGCEKVLFVSLVYSIVDRGFGGPDICELVVWISGATSTIMAYMEKIGVCARRCATERWPTVRLSAMRDVPNVLGHG